MSYLSSPLANSTKISKNICKESTESIVATHIFVRTSSARLDIPKPTSTIATIVDQKNSTSNDITTIKDYISESNISSINIAISSAVTINTSNNNNSSKGSPRKSIGTKKSVVSRKVTAKKGTEPIKAICCNGTYNNVTVEKILKQINMSKYQQSFKKIDVVKFKELKEIDLNAIGITRPSEIKIFMEAIKKIKTDFKY